MSHPRHGTSILTLFLVVMITSVPSEAGLLPLTNGQVFTLPSCGTAVFYADINGIDPDHPFFVLSFTLTQNSSIPLTATVTQHAPVVEADGSVDIEELTKDVCPELSCTVDETLASSCVMENGCLPPVGRRYVVVQSDPSFSGEGSFSLEMKVRSMIVSLS